MLLEKGHCLQRHALEAYPGRISAAEDSFAATSLTTLIAMVSEGLGITLLPNLAVEAGVVGTEQVQLTPLPDACPPSRGSCLAPWIRAVRALQQARRPVAAQTSRTVRCHHPGQRRNLGTNVKASATFAHPPSLTKLRDSIGNRFNLEFPSTSPWSAFQIRASVPTKLLWHIRCRLGASAASVQLSLHHLSIWEYRSRMFQSQAASRGARDLALGVPNSGTGP